MKTAPSAQYLDDHLFHDALRVIDKIWVPFFIKSYVALRRTLLLLTMRECLLAKVVVVVASTPQGPQTSELVRLELWRTLMQTNRLRLEGLFGGESLAVARGHLREYPLGSFAVLRYLDAI